VASFYRALQDLSAGEHLKLTLHGSLSGAGLAHDLPEIKPLIGVTQEPCQDPAACPAEEDG
jgi:hypothetical protein